MKRTLLSCLLLAVALCAAGAKDFVFAGYNLANYAPLALPGDLDKGKPHKTAEAADAVLGVIKEINPDILGVCEMGAAPQFEEFRKRLEQEKLGFVDAEFVDAADPDRHLALVSRFPIVARQSLPDLSYESNGVREKVRRGILDVTLRINDQYVIRVVGAHLKSKRFTPEGDEGQRRNEAHLLRSHINEILAADPKVNLLVFGDFNDTKEQPAIREVTGRRGAPEALVALSLEDSVGDHWTHYWKVDDVYSRIDYLFVNRALSPEVVRAKSYIYRSPNWNDASDHRPVVATIHPVEQ